MDDPVIEGGPESFKKQGNMDYAAGDYLKALDSYNKALAFFPSTQLCGEQQALCFCIRSNRMQTLLKIPNATFLDEREELISDVLQLYNQPNKFVDEILVVKTLCRIARSYCQEHNPLSASVYLRMRFHYADDVLKKETNQLLLDVTRPFWKVLLRIGDARVLRSINKAAQCCSICLKECTITDTEDDEYKCIELKCEHTLHLMCALRWFYDTKYFCPMCGERLNEWIA
ncbi:hypothetical protein M441DRAFT_459624 [Trichoderma asperellum CBS 433.97]|uniref:RING-type domain-containing protein n=1 Tax=Trichoderma asperellum (strain ATCC 204424 / CBS 433.97 / NBRC 101777) TaxID=1042311 RepID=A0A2T3Z6C4_TRIA4|nr:hypothetical protein M441DRAFT_459624 [Trichoderma asperellum CBS 433.97]PTB40359.1 hypothetical protein M441DRAFT_459624 [Trichoderma asperellum CBS 433.97]WVH32713.1 tetratricopeptide repeat protein [Trichoderma asperellum]